MSQSTHNEVVDIQFKNADFERNVAQSIKTLDDLEKALDMKNISKSFDEMNTSASKVDFKKVTDNINLIANSFTLVGNIQQKFFKDIATEVTNWGKKVSGILTSTLTIMKDKGWSRAMNIENAKFQLEGLGIAWDQVSSSIDFAVDNTAFGLDEAAKAAGQLAASGVELGDEMSHALRAISGSASMANTSYADMADIFQAAASKGKVMAMEFNRMAQRGLNAKAIVADAIHVTEAEVGEMASKGKISFKIFSDAMYEAFGEYATKANDSFQGSMANMKAALGRIGALFATPIIQNAPKVFNSLRLMFNGLKKEVEPLGETFDYLVKGLSTLTSLFLENEHVINTVKNLYNAFLYLMVDLGALLEPVGKVIAKIIPDDFPELLEKASNAFKEFANNLVISPQVSYGIESVFNLLFKILGLIKDIGGAVINALSPLGPVIGTAINYLSVLIGLLADYISNAIEVYHVSDMIKGVGNILNSIVSSMVSYLPDALNIIVAVLYTVGQKIAESVNFIIVSFNNLTNKGFNFDFIDNFKKKASDLATVLSHQGKSVHGFFEEFDFSGIKETFDSIISSFTETEGAVGSFVNVLSTFKDKVGEYIGGMGDSLLSGISNVKDFVTKLNEIVDVNSIAKIGFMILLGRLVTEMTKFTKTMNGTIGAFENIFTQIGNVFEESSKSIKYENCIKLATAVGILTASIIALSKVPINDLGKAITAIIVIFGSLAIAVTAIEKFANATESFAKKKQIEKVGTNLNQQITNVGTTISGGVKGVFDNLQNGAKSLVTGITGIADGIKTSISSAIKDFGRTIEFSAILISVATSVLILTKALANVADIWREYGTDDNKGILYALATIGGMLAAIVLSSIAIANLAKNMNESAIGILAMGVAVNLLVMALEPIVEIAKKDLINLAAGVGAIAAMLISLSFACKQLKDVEFDSSTALMIAEMVLSIKILTGVLEELAQIGGGEGGVGFGALGIALGILAGELLIFGGAMWALSKFDLSKISGQLIETSVALGIFSAVIVALGIIANGKEGFNIICGGILSLAAAIVVVGSIGAIIMAICPKFEAFGQAMLNLSKSVLIGAAGLAALGIALGVFVVSISVAATAIVTNGAIIGTALVTLGRIIINAITSLGSDLTKMIYTIITSVAKAIYDASDEWGKTLTKVVAVICYVIVANADKIADALITLVDAVLKRLEQHSTSIVASLVGIIGGIIGGVIAGLPLLVKNLQDAIYKAIQVLTDNLDKDFDQFKRDVDIKIGKFFLGVGPFIIQQINDLGTSILGTLKTWVADMPLIGKWFSGGVEEGISSGIDGVEKAADQMGMAAVEASANALGTHSLSWKGIDQGGDYGGGVGFGFLKSIPNIVDIFTSGGEQASGALGKSLEGGLPNVQEIFGNFGTEGIGSFVQSIADNEGNAQNAVGGMMDKINSLMNQKAVEGTSNAASIFTQFANWSQKTLNLSANYKASAAKTHGASMGDFIRMDRQAVDDYKESLKNANQGVEEFTINQNGAGSSGKSAAKGTKKSTEKVKELFDALKDGEKVSKGINTTMATAFSSIEKASDLNIQKIGDAIFAVPGAYQDMYKDLIKTSQDGNKEITSSLEELSTEMLNGYGNSVKEITKTTDEYSEETQAKLKKITDQLKSEFITKTINKFAEHILITSDTYTKELANMDKSSEEYLEAMKTAWDDYMKKIEEALKMDLFEENTISWQENITKMNENMEHNIAYMNNYEEAFGRLAARFAKENWDTTILEEWGQEGYSAYGKVTAALTATNAEMEEFFNTYDSGQKKVKEVTESVVASLALAVSGWQETVEGTVNYNELYSDSLGDLGEKIKDVSVIVQSRYLQMYDAIGKVLEDSIDMFEKYTYEQDETLTASELNEISESNKEHLIDYADTFESLLSKGLPDKLAQQLVEMGDDGFKKMKALNDLTAAELQKWVADQEEILTLQKAIQSRISESYAIAGQGAIEAFKNQFDPTGTNEAVRKLVEEAIAQMDLTVESVKGPAQKLVSTWSEEIEMSFEMVEGDGEKLVTTICNTIDKKIDESQDDLEKSGKEIVEGVSKGVEDNVDILEDVMGYICSRAEQAVDDYFDIGSPSKLMMKKGKFIDEGLAYGIDDGKKDITDSIYGINEEATNAMNSVIDHIMGFIDGEMEMDPTIRPILDLSMVKEEARNLDGILTDSKSLSVARSISMSRANRAVLNGNENMQAGTYNSGNEMNFYIYGADNQDPREIAYQVQDIINREFKRGI